MTDIVPIEAIVNSIFTLRSFQVMLDRDLSELYQVPTKRLNEQVKRNIERFPEQFRFQLTQDEKSELVANCDRFEYLVSLKDLGKKWFAFSKMDFGAVEMLGKLEKLPKVKI